ncbi:MAG: hypothetical protein ACN6N7_07145 [Chryseobacterium culicis]
MFKIITKGKAMLGSYDPEAQDTSEAIYTIYKADYDFMIFICWNGFHIPVDGSSLSQIYSDVVNMLEFIKIGEHDFWVSFLGSCFTAVWYFSIKNEEIEIKAEWTDIAPYHYENRRVENLREVSDVVIINKNNFINEWDNILRMIKNDLLSVGYNSRLEGFYYLNDLD